MIVKLGVVDVIFDFSWSNGVLSYLIFFTATDSGFCCFAEIEKIFCKRFEFRSLIRNLTILVSQ